MATMAQSKWFSRKLISTGVVFIVATFVLLIGRAQFSEWSSLVTFLLAIYTGGNVAERIANNKTSSTQ
jgi:hypothetical protein